MLRGIDRTIPLCALRASGKCPQPVTNVERRSRQGPASPDCKCITAWARSSTSSILTAEGGGLPPGRPLPTAPGGIAKPSRVLRAYPMLTRRAPGLG